ncbi:MAG TPA: GIY-YIG nuclease family protein [Anaerolineales bacterium]|jgi:putative endonuclease
MPYFCYIVKCVDGSFYTGWTTDPARREKQHNAGTGARYTRTHRPVQMVYIEEQPDRTSAIKRELAIKHLTHEKKDKLVNSRREE